MKYWGGMAEPQQEPKEGDWIEVKARWGKRFVEMPNPILGKDHFARFYFSRSDSEFVGLRDSQKLAIIRDCSHLDVLQLIELVEEEIKRNNNA